MAAYIPKDIGGFGRLANIEMQKRREDRLDKESAIRQKLSGIQLKQAEINLEKIGKQKQIASDITALNQNLPENETHFTATYKYLMENGLSSQANTLADAQSNRVDKLWGKDKTAAAKLFNESIGVVMNTKIDPVLGHKNLVKADQDGKTVYMERTKDGFRVVPMPEKTNIVGEKKKGVQLKDQNLRVINDLQAKILDGSATDAEKATYKLAEADYTKPKRFTDSITGKTYTESQSLPKGFPSLKSKAAGDKSLEGGLSPTEVDKALGGIQYKEIFDPARLSKKEREDFRNSIFKSDQMLDIVKNLRDDIMKSGVRTVDIGTISRRGADHKQALMLYKEILNLGVLNGPDLEIMEEILVNPAGAKSLALGKEYVLPKFNSVIDTIERQTEYARGRLGAAASPLEGVKDLKTEEDRMNYLDQRGEELMKTPGMTTEKAYEIMMKEMGEK